ncbi:MAG: SMC-Scp complex subunit ScpB [Eubacterium sp.]|nr:SMC-Scp complex subunit ScpB [Eubacterium sp.]
MNQTNYMAVLEAILFTMGESVELSKLAQALEIDKNEVKQYLDELTKKYESMDSGVQLIELDGAYQMCTKPEMYEYLIKIAKLPRKYVLTDVQLETLSIIAYKQPITKAEIENIRGVSSDHVVNRLVEYNLVCELGRLDAPGRPMLFGTTEEFLRSFGVHSLEELPALNQDTIEEFKREAQEELEYEANEEENIII